MCYLFCKKCILHKIFLDIEKRLVLNKTGHFLKSGHCCVGAFLRRLKESLMLAPTYRSMTAETFGNLELGEGVFFRSIFSCPSTNNNCKNCGRYQD